LSFYTVVVVKKNIKKEVKKTIADYFLDEAEEWIDHVELVCDNTETLYLEDAADADYCD
jgi:hypothetical protein